MGIRLLNCKLTKKRLPPPARICEGGRGGLCLAQKPLTGRRVPAPNLAEGPPPSGFATKEALWVGVGGRTKSYQGNCSPSDPYLIVNSPQCLRSCPTSCFGGEEGLGEGGGLGLASDHLQARRGSEGLRGNWWGAAVVPQPGIHQEARVPGLLPPGALPEAQRGAQAAAPSVPHSWSWGRRTPCVPAAGRRHPGPSTSAWPRSFSSTRTGLRRRRPARGRGCLPLRPTPDRALLVGTEWSPPQAGCLPSQEPPAEGRDALVSH